MAKALLAMDKLDRRRSASSGWTGPFAHIVAEVAWEAGFKDGSDLATAHDGRVMSNAQRLIFPMTALRKRELVRFATRPDGYTGSAYMLTREGQQAVDALLAQEHLRRAEDE